MSWNSSIIAIKTNYSPNQSIVENELGLCLNPPGETISFEDATGSYTYGTSIGFVDDWTVLCDLAAFYNVNDPRQPADGMIWKPKVDEGLKKLSINSLALGVILSGVSDTYGLTIYENGLLLRCQLLQEGILLIDAGTPTNEEHLAYSVTDDEESRVFHLLKNYGLSIAMLENAEFTNYGA